MAYNAYLITWTTYGTWLPGDERGWVKSGVRTIQTPDPNLESRSRERMADAQVILTPEQRELVEQTIREHCVFRKWSLHAVCARSNHVHLVVTADVDPNEVMKQLKGWCSRKLSDQANLATPVAKKAGRRRWFTEDGDKQLIETEVHLFNAVRYVMERQ